MKNTTQWKKSCDENAKWYQIMRNFYVQTFYLSYHFPVTSAHHSHNISRIPDKSSDQYCKCSQVIEDIDMHSLCNICIESESVMQSAENGQFCKEITNHLYPIKCDQCSKRFADILICNDHIKSCHTINKGEYCCTTIICGQIKRTFNTERSTH